MKLAKNSLALLSLFVALALPASAQAGFGIEPGSLHTSYEVSKGIAGVPQASSHPYSFTLGFKLNTKEGTIESEGGEMRSVLVDLPPGFAGDPFSVDRCTRQEFEGFLPNCSPNTQVGTLTARLPELGIVGGGALYNMVPPPGVPAQLGFSVAGFNALQSISLRSEPANPLERYGLLDAAYGLPLEATAIEATIWGTPADPGHDEERGGDAAEGYGPGTSYVGPHKAFLTLPAECSTPIKVRVEVDSKLDPGNYVSEETESLDPGEHPASPQGCGSVPFSPKVAAATTSKAASSSSGLDFELKLPNEGLTSPGGIAETEPEKMEVALPEGISANPSAAEGLATCSEAQYKSEQLDTNPGEGCPEASKLGSIVAHSPLLDEPIEGSLYLATPYQNPEGTLLAIYLVFRAQERGVLLKQSGRIEPDPNTGRLVTTLEGLPPLPYSDATLHFKEGARGVLVTPSTCGTYTTTAKLYPFSEPDNPVIKTANMQIERGVNGGACPSGNLPFHPGFEAGTLNNAAGAHSPLIMRLTRQDGDQDLTKISTTLPQGLLASLVGVSRCSDADIAQARSRTGANGGHEEQANPSCPASSQIGTTTNGAGVGSVLTWVPGNLYLAGPYNGAPLSIVAIVPGVAGPFDVGTIVVRLALRFNPVTAQAEADGSSSDPIPHILKGIPLAVRDIRVYVNRPNWTFNPTSCEQEATVGTLFGGGQNAFSTLDDSPFSLDARFQAADCANLAFKPHLRLNLKGGTKRGKFPKIRGEYKPRPGDANLDGLVLRLPHSEFIEQGHFKTICTRVQYSAGDGFGSQCPKGSVYGWARAFTPLLEEPLEGPVRLRSSNHNLPDLVASLHGIADIEAVARIDSKNGGLRVSFSRLPDAPISKVIVSMQGGQKGLIVNSTDICRGTHRANAAFTAQSGRKAKLNPPLKAKCKKAHKKKHAGHHKRAGR